MLEQMDLDKCLDKKKYKEVEDKVVPRLCELQRQLKDLKIPVLIIMEGWGAAGKGTLINRLITPLDQRGVKVYTLEQETKEEKEHAFFWPFWTNLPSEGRMHIYDQSWYSRAIEQGNKQNFAGIGKRLEEINFQEQQLVEDGMLVLKFFLHISKEEQKRRLMKLSSNKDTRWKVSTKDLKENKHYQQYLKQYNQMLIQTDTPYAVWNVIEATDKRYAATKIMTIVEKSISCAIKFRETNHSETNEEQDVKCTGEFGTHVLQGVDLNKEMSKKEYKAKLKYYQKRLSTLQNKMFREKVPVMVALEGWDAAGKGGAIKRITQKLDPRGYEVIPIAAPNDHEKRFHYLWRFWQTIPKAGHLTIFDRTWYGRVLVERVEGFAKKNEWGRAYQEINQMEETLSSDGYVILKFWLHIDKEEQERRFKERQNTPEKQWKITDEDWRNREKWDDYVEAVDEMVIRTSTEEAPWTIIEANSKYYARIKILKTIVERLEERLGM